MKVNREKFLAAALLLSSVTACGKLKGKETAQAAPDTVQSAAVDTAAAAATAPANEENATGSKGVQPTAGNVKNANARAKVGVVGPGGETIPVVGPGKEVIAPNNEGVIAPGKEVIAPGNENVPVIAPTNENIPAPGTTGTPMHIPKGRVRSGK